MDGAGVLNGWSRLDFRGQTGANRMRVCGKHGAGMRYKIKPAPLVGETGAVDVTDLRHRPCIGLHRPVSALHRPCIGPAPLVGETGGGHRPVSARIGPTR